MDAFDYELPGELIAQEPAQRRDASRLMAVSRATPDLGHHEFSQLPRLLRAGDLLVMNDTRVLAARIAARRATGGAVELLFLAPVTTASDQDPASTTGAGGSAPSVWQALARPAKRVRVGDVLEAGGHELTVTAQHDGGRRELSFPVGTNVSEWLQRHGTMPLPPYIHADQSVARRDFDQERYQTVYAREPGAVAAPTAGLHFTQDLLGQLRDRGVETTFLTLAVGAGTFRPVTAERVEEHRMDAERYRISAATALAVNRARAEGRRVVAVGTTSVRALEHAAGTTASGTAATTGGRDALAATTGSADIFITPGYRFRVVDAMITNLHLPRSTPILLAAAMVGRERLLAAYAEAVAHRYRFYSYGDAMLLQ